MGDWLARPEQKKREFLRTFSRGLAARPQVYGVSPEDAAEAVRLVELAEEAAFVASAPATRTSLTIAAKQAALTAAEKFCRPLAAFIRLNPRLSESDLLMISVPPKGERRRVPAPTTAPMLSIRRIIPGGHELELVDSATPDRRSKPAGVKSLELFVAYSPSHGPGEALTADTILRNGKPHGTLTRPLAQVIHPNERVGSVANYIGRWLNGRGEAGPFSLPVRMVLAMPGDGNAVEAA